MSTRLGDYDYVLPRGLIAQRPLERREGSRMMVLHRSEQKIEHRQFRELKLFLQAGDLVVLNDTRVLPARRLSDDGAIEFLFLEQLGPARWKCMVKPGRKMRVGATSTLDGVSMRVEEITPEGDRIVSLDQDINVYAGGSVPLPPYVTRPVDESDAVRYQTVFAREPGAVAAPTAGLHFTADILSEIPHAFVTLHVGPGTFLPVRADNLAEHRMHAERFSISAKAADRINKAQRIVAVGTTIVRVLETAGRHNRVVLRGSAGASSAMSRARGDSHPELFGDGAEKSGRGARAAVEAQSGETALFIYPPFPFRVVDALLTNFHLPRSTLLMLVSAFAGREFILQAYEEAVRERYRFYSYGDCMLIL
jgi:S-adenosylmethionine:tRNA ribosyltransferase-isomerase